MNRWNRCLHIASGAPPVVVAGVRLWMAECGRRQPLSRMVPPRDEPGAAGPVCATCRALRDAAAPRP